MNTERTWEERKESLDRLSCINVMREEGEVTRDTWFITTTPNGSIHMPDETKHVPRRVELIGYTSTVRDYAADFFIDNPNAQWLLLNTMRNYSSFGWRLTVLAWGE